jgi:hypothetical protein
MRNEGFRNDQLWDNIDSEEYLNHLKSDSPILYPDVDWMDILFRPAIDHKLQPECTRWVTTLFNICINRIFT